MNARQPDQRYQDPGRQGAYEAGFAQMYDHDSFAFLERVEGIVDSHLDDDLAARDPGARADARAAALEGAADALRNLARGQRDGARFARQFERP